MKEKTDKIITWLALGVALIATVFSIVFAMNNGGVKDLNAVQQGSMFDITYIILLCIIAISIIAILLFLVVKLVNRFRLQPGYWKKFLLIVAVVAAVCVLAIVFTTGDDVKAALLEKYNVSVNTSYWIGAACYLVYIEVILAALAIIFTEVLTSLKKK
ncbi:MAG: hypothetical protein IJ761_01105 [Bacteroidales bacterium]|nr:hypothetical protein [Bacteroidales bacterium]